MAPMPPEFYLPAFGALLGALGILTSAIKVLYSAKQQADSDRHAYAETIAARAIEAMTLSTEVIRANSEALARMAESQGAAHDHDRAETRTARP